MGFISVRGHTKDGRATLQSAYWRPASTDETAAFFKQSGRLTVLQRRQPSEPGRHAPFCLSAVPAGFDPAERQDHGKRSGGAYF